MSRSEGMPGIDRNIVVDDDPRDPGMYLMWSSRAGWPVVEILRVEEADGRDGQIVFTTAGNRTDRFCEIRRDPYLGYSAITTDALAHFEVLYQKTRSSVSDMLAGRGDPLADGGAKVAVSRADDTCPSRHGQYACSLPLGHDGRHATAGGFTAWPRFRVTKVAP